MKIAKAPTFWGMADLLINLFELKVAADQIRAVVARAQAEGKSPDEATEMLRKLCDEAREGARFAVFGGGLMGSEWPSGIGQSVAVEGEPNKVVQPLAQEPGGDNVAVGGDESAGGTAREPT